MVFANTRTALTESYANGTVIQVTDARGLPDANGVTFSNAVKANYIIDDTQPLFDILDGNGIIINQLPLKYLSAVENPGKTDADITLTNQILGVGTQKALNETLAQRGDIIATSSAVKFIVGFNNTDTAKYEIIDNIEDNFYTRLKNQATGKITIKFTGSNLSDNNDWVFDLSAILPSSTIKNINGIANFKDDNARVYDGNIVDIGNNKFKIANNASYWSDTHPVSGVSIGDYLIINYSATIVGWSETQPQQATGLVAGTGITLNQIPAGLEISATSSGLGGVYGNSQNYWVLKDVDDNPNAFIFNTLQKAHDAYLASGKLIGVINIGAGTWTDTTNISATNLHIRGAGVSNRSVTQLNGTITITGHRITLENILHGNISANPPIVINCAGTLTENGVPNIGRGKIILKSCSFSLSSSQTQAITITAINNWVNYSDCDFSGKQITLPDNTIGTTWYYLFSQCSNLIVNAGANTILLMDEASSAIIEGVVNASASIIRGRSVVALSLGTPVFKGNQYIYNGNTYQAKTYNYATGWTGATMPYRDFTNFKQHLPCKIGSVIPVFCSITEFLTNYPEFVEADGTAISALTQLSATEKTALIAELGGLANIPDMRGATLRGIDRRTTGNRDQAGVRTPGNYQADGVGSHSHSFRNYAFYNNGGVWGAGAEGGRSPVSGASYGNFTDTSTFNSGNTETTVKNIANYFFIRIK